MTIIKWDPFKNMAVLQDRINKLFDDSFPNAETTDENLAVNVWKPVVDIYETESVITIAADLPGVSKEDVNVEIKDNVLTISGHRRPDNTLSEENYYRRERSTGAFQRTFSLRNLVPPDQIRATFKNGVLFVEMPKQETEKPKQIHVDIE